MMTRILSLFRRRRRRAPLPHRPVPLDALARMDAAVRRQEHYNFLHYDGAEQPNPAETICP